ncbi:MAG: hypothetical protein AAF799_00765 [Myxococcota bacterium]
MSKRARWLSKASCWIWVVPASCLFIASSTAQAATGESEPNPASEHSDDPAPKGGPGSTKGSPSEDESESWYSEIDWGVVLGAFALLGHVWNWVIEKKKQHLAHNLGLTADRRRALEARRLEWALEFQKTASELWYNLGISTRRMMVLQKKTSLLSDFQTKELEKEIPQFRENLRLAFALMFRGRILIHEETYDDVYQWMNELAGAVSKYIQFSPEPLEDLSPFTKALNAELQKPFVHLVDAADGDKAS